MNITIIGTGYVGLVTGLCFASVGHDVVCLDNDKKKVKLLNAGKPTIYENNVSEYLKKNLNRKQIQFTDSYTKAINHTNIIFIAVDTPPKKSGESDLTSLKKVCKSVSKVSQKDLIIIEKSTVPVGTHIIIKNIIEKESNYKIKVKIVSNPEFLREGCAINDFIKPDRIVIGTDDLSLHDIFKEIYAPFNRKMDKIQFMDIKSAELTKYASNAMLATKISFINEIANIAEVIGANIDFVRKGIGADSRIGHEFLYPGCGYGGSCFPKDLKSLIHTSKKKSYKPELLQSVEDLNKRQKILPYIKIRKYYKNDLKNKKIAVWGLSFKPNTDDTRFAPSIDIIEKLLSSGAFVSAYDPVASLLSLFNRYKKKYRESNTSLSAIHKADALIICTEWKEFWSINPNEFKTRMISPVIFDGRNIYNDKIMSNAEIIYFPIGKKLSL